MLARDLCKKGHVIRNVAMSGADTEITLNRFPRVVPQENPDFVIVSLSLANEGLHSSEDACTTFQENMKKLVQMIKNINAVPILGSVYPNDEYNERHYELLKMVHNNMLTWGEIVIDFLRTTDDGNGHWKPNSSIDAGHPNDLGHKLMYEAINKDIFYTKKS